MKEFKKGQQVVHDYLGKGEIVKLIKSSLDSKLTVAYMVRFDKTPPMRYNMRENPTMVFPESLKPINKLKYMKKKRLNHELN